MLGEKTFPTLILSRSSADVELCRPLTNRVASKISICLPEIAWILCRLLPAPAANVSLQYNATNEIASL